MKEMIENVTEVLDFSSEIDDTTNCVDHLLRKGNRTQNIDWVRPECDDIQEVITDYQVIPCNVIMVIGLI